ncbi:hypothetical protein L8V01_08420 [Corynebacterium sp. c8Ua_181]|uniref:Uncharacterized protein n=1 Tax=Corynebacterium curieae TaxID=2913500 RepID=A0A9X3MAX1_9CORY|nr:hypothetical protein [Corynebacterium curieae]MCZ9307497.1 hypothetical protein [Corynebacterium curieae]MDV2424278.1 hypothetical protein [Corynebacterium curieae]
MNPTTLNVAFKTASNLWSQFHNYRDEKSREAYTALEEAAQKMDERDNSNFAESRRQAGAVTRAAHSRLERALEEFNDYREDATERLNDAKEEATKKAKKARKQAKKDSQKAQKNLKKKSSKVAKKQKKNKKSSKGWIFAGIIALLSAAAGAAYYWLRSNDKPSQTPPRVDDFQSGSHTAPESTLVYTSTSENDAKSDLVEEGAVRDEELLGSIDEQLAKHREEEAAQPTDTTRITDDHQNEGKHRLQTDE